MAMADRVAILNRLGDIIGKPTTGSPGDPPDRRESQFRVRVS
jgi:hypothetical protein